jgi:hypothetical protein
VSEPSSRDLGLELLAASAAYEIPTVRHGHQDIVLSGVVIRSRRLLRAAYELADQDMVLEAQVLLRVLTEYAITLAWLLIDIETNLCRWVIGDTNRRFTLHNEVAKASPGTELLARDTRRAMAARREALVAMLREKEQPLDLPPVEVRAAQAEDDGGHEGLKVLYALPYRADSEAAVHATVWSIDKLMELYEDGGVILNPNYAPSRRQVDVYGAAAGMLGMVLMLAYDAMGNEEQRQRIAAIAERVRPPERIPEDIPGLAG